MIIEMEERKCEAKGCNVTFRITKHTPQDYCSEQCRDRDRQLSGRDKIQMRKYLKANPDRKRDGLKEFWGDNAKVFGVKL